MPLTEKVLYRAQVKATAGRDTRAVSSDGVLDLTVTRPRELGGTNGRGTTPEQLFAASYAASFLGIMRLVAGREGIALPTDTEVEASVGVGPTPRGFGIEVELRIWLPGLPRAEADVLVEKSHAACPYSNATRGNVSVRLVLA
jgi:lipoyl-dependent peroxiredoxin